jgi:tRNA(Ile)-lysidine synthase
MASPLVDIARDTIQNYAMIERGERVLVAVSGGPDSVCLLDVLHELGYPLEVAHLDHQTRGTESEDDAAFVERLCGGYEIPCHIESRPIEKEAGRSALSFEEFAREARYEFLLRTARERGCAVIATGHHTDDLVETILMRILRGTTPRGMLGIPPVRVVDECRIVRPLYTFRRVDIMGYLQGKELSYRVDSSNSDTRFVRNRIRSNLLPLLESDYNPQVRAALVRLALLQLAESNFLDSEADWLLSDCMDENRVKRRVFSEAHLALQRRALARLVWQCGIDTDFEHINDACLFIVQAPAGKSFDLGSGMLLRNSRNYTEFMTPAFACATQEASLRVPGSVTAFGKRLRARILKNAPKKPLQLYCTPKRQVFDADTLGPSVILRMRQPGDRFTPLGMTGTRKLKDYFVDRGLPMTDRNRALLVVSGERIAWVAGYAVSAEFAVTDQTRRYAEIVISDAAE